MSIQLWQRRIHEHRVRLGLSPEFYGIRIGVSGHTVRRVERGYCPTLTTQKKFGDALGVDHVDLFGMADIGGPDVPTLSKHYRQAMAA